MLFILSEHWIGLDLNMTIRLCESRTVFCRRAALKYMVAEEFEEEEIEEMRQSLKHEGWERNQDLPDNWFLKTPTIKKDHYSYKFVNELGSLFESTRSALDYIKTSRPEAVEEIAKLCRFSRVTRDQVEREVSRAVVKKEPETSGKKTEKAFGSKMESGDPGCWIKDETLPAGWKIRKGKGDVEIFLTDSKKQVETLFFFFSFSPQGGW